MLEENMLEENIILQQNYCYVLANLIYNEIIHSINDILEKTTLVRMRNGYVEFEDKGAYIWYNAQLENFSLKDTDKFCRIGYQIHIKFDKFNEKKFVDCYLLNEKNKKKLFERIFEIQELDRSKIDGLCEDLSKVICMSIMDDLRDC